MAGRGNNNIKRNKTARECNRFWALERRAISRATMGGLGHSLGPERTWLGDHLLPPCQRDTICPQEGSGCQDMRVMKAPLRLPSFVAQ